MDAHQRNMHCEKLKYLNLTVLFPPGLSEIKYFLDFVTNQWCKQNMSCFFSVFSDWYGSSC